MHCDGIRARASRPVTLAAIFLATLLLATGMQPAAVASAQDDHALESDAAYTLGGPGAPRSAYTNQFNGSFVEYSVRGAAVFASTLDGWGADVGMRHSFPMYLGDTRLAYRFDRLSGNVGEVDLHGANLTFALHPFYLALLGSGLTSHALSSLHLEVGLGVQHGRLQPADDDRLLAGDVQTYGAWSLPWSVGAGFDLPLFNPNRGHAPWLNINYRYSRSRLSFDNGAEFAVGAHSLFAGLGWRFNGLLF